MSEERHDINIYELYKNFERIRNIGWLKPLGNNQSAIGYTFELLLGKRPDQKCNPDYKNIEIKTQKYNAIYKSINLFAIKPSNDEQNCMIKVAEQYGYSDLVERDKKILNLSVYTNKKTKISKYYYSLKIDKNSQEINLIIQDKNNTILNQETYWSFQHLKDRINHKIKILAIVMVKENYINGKKYFYYDRIFFYKIKNVDTFFELLEKGSIGLNIKVGIVRSGDLKGKKKDRGSTFFINIDKIKLLYDEIFI